MHTESVAKEQTFKIRFDDADRARLDALAAHYNLSAASVLRFLIKREADALGIVAQTKASKTKKR